MNSAIFWRLMWKEYRQQQSLWIAIAFAGLIFQVATLVYCTLNGLADLPDRLFTVALSVPILYSLGCGAALFAGEHEAGTFPFQQALPATAARVFAAKFAFAAASALVLFPVLWLLAFALASWRLPDAVWHGQLWAGGIVASLEILIWSVLGSLVLRRVLPAAVTGGVTAVVLGYGSLVAVVAFGDLFEQQANEYFNTLPLRSLFALLAFCISIKLGQQWFNEHPRFWTPAVPRRTSVVSRERVKPATTSSMLVRLLWHEARQARPTILWCTGGYLISASVLASTHSLNSTSFLYTLILVATIFGASVFAGDQRQENYLFFTEHGVRPRLVWFSRQVVWCVMLGVLVAFAWCVQWLTNLLEPYQFRDARIITGLVVLMFAVGQLCSILIRSNIVAVFTSVMCGLLLFFWSMFTVGMGVPWWLSAFPLPLILVAASWLYAPKWIQQRHTWRVRFFTAATIVVPLSCVVGAVAAYRVHEIPAIQTSFASTPLVSNGDSPEARETAAMYVQAYQLLRSKLKFDPDDGSAVASSDDDEWQKGIGLFQAASNRKDCRFRRWDDPKLGPPFDGSQLATAVLAEAKMLVDKGEPDAAATLYLGLLELASHYYQQDDPHSYYMAYGLAVESKLFADLPVWAASDATSYDATIEFLNQLQQWCGEHEIDWQRAKATQHAVLQRVIAMDDVAMRRYYGASGTELAAIKGLGMLVPWERVRMSRLADVAAESELQGIEQIRERGPRIPPYKQADLPWDVTLTATDGNRMLLRSTDVTGWVMNTRWLAIALDRGAPGNVFVEQKMQLERKAVQTQLALIAWQKQYGQLPDSLDELLNEPFESLPLDPYTKQPFVYLPTGVVEEVWDDPNGGMGSMMGMGGGMYEEGEPDVDWQPPKRRLVRSAPFLWSPGATLRYAPSASRGPSVSPAPGDFRDQSGRVFSSVRLLSEGVRYVLPKSEAVEESQQPSDSSDDADALPSDE